MIPLSIVWPGEVDDLDRLAIKGLAGAYIAKCTGEVSAMSDERRRAAFEAVSNQTTENIVLVSMGFAYNAMRVERISGNAVEGAGSAGIDSDSPEFAAILNVHETLGRLLDDCGSQLIDNVDPIEALMCTLRFGDEEQLVEDVANVIGITFFEHILGMF